MKRKNTDKSFAGKLGASARWKDHIKIQTTLIRVQKNDADSILCMAALSGISSSAVVHSLLEHSSYNIRTSTRSKVDT